MAAKGTDVTLKTHSKAQTTATLIHNLHLDHLSLSPVLPTHLFIYSRTLYEYVYVLYEYIQVLYEYI